jgi:hypothetical protein
MTQAVPHRGITSGGASPAANAVKAETELRGPRGNERLTAWAGAVLFVLLAVEGVTILRIHALVVPHIVVGMLLIGPVALKLGSTGYRFVRYYTGSAPYLRQGPPTLPLRLLAPVLIVATGALFATGVGLILVGPDHRGALLGLHKASFVVWFAVASIHVLAYVGRVPALIAGDLSRSRRQYVGHRAARIAVTVAAVVAGVALAMATAHLAGPWLQRGGGG